MEIQVIGPTLFPLFSTAYITGQTIPIPHSEPFSLLRCRNGSQTYLLITSDLIELYITKKLIGYNESFYKKYFIFCYIKKALKLF